MDNPASCIPHQIREGTSTSGSERNWPYNSWWVAAHQSEVGDRPTQRWILEMPMALFRTAAGKVVVLHNRCPHRWAPLHLGEVIDDRLACPYHGMEFAPSGQCMKVPTQDSVPPAMKVRAFPAVERYGFIWVWTGDEHLADPALIPDDLAYLDNPEWPSVWGYKSVEANYMQMKENVLDLTHFAFLHKHSLGVTDWDRPPAVEVADGRVTYRQHFVDMPLQAIYAAPAGKPVGKRMNRMAWGTQLTPGAHHGGVDVHDPSPGSGELERFCNRIIHLTTPVSLGRTHYYWAMARDHGAPFDFEKTRAGADIVFGEDIAIVSASQEMSRCSIDHNATEVSVQADQAAIQGRRLVAALVEAERAAAAQRGQGSVS